MAGILQLARLRAFGFIVVMMQFYFELPLQVVYHDNSTNFAEINKFERGTAVIVTGTLGRHAPGQTALEIQATGGGWRAPARDYPLL